MKIKRESVGQKRRVVSSSIISGWLQKPMGLMFMAPIPCYIPEVLVKCIGDKITLHISVSGYNKNGESYAEEYEPEKLKEGLSTHAIDRRMRAGDMIRFSLSREHAVGPTPSSDAFISFLVEGIHDEAVPVSNAPVLSEGSVTGSRDSGESTVFE